MSKKERRFTAEFKARATLECFRSATVAGPRRSRSEPRRAQQRSGCRDQRSCSTR